MSKEAIKLALDRAAPTAKGYVIVPDDAFKVIKEALAKQEQGEPYGYVDAKGGGLFIYGEHQFQNTKNAELVPVYTTPQQRTWVGLTPLNIEDEYVRNYLWERALIAIDDPCCRSHPHENMNEYCQRRTELARHQSKLKDNNK